MPELRARRNSDVTQVRAELTKRIEKVTLIPSGDRRIDSGTWDFAGREVSTVPGDWHGFATV